MADWNTEQLSVYHADHDGPAEGCPLCEHEVMIQRYYARGASSWGWTCTCADHHQQWGWDTRREAVLASDEHIRSAAAGSATPTQEACCELHQSEGCCDPDDCGPCCENCPTCPTLARWATPNE
jgi:hypothetical protein